MICNNCDVVMHFVMRFDGKNMYRLRRCPKCYYETKQVPLILDDETTQNKLCNKSTKRKTQKKTSGKQKKVRRR